MNFIDNNKYKEIHYFGDKYERDGNDYGLLNHKYVIEHKIDNINDTNYILNFIINKSKKTYKNIKNYKK